MTWLGIVVWAILQYGLLFRETLEQSAVFGCMHAVLECTRVSHVYSTCGTHSSTYTCTRGRTRVRARGRTREHMCSIVVPKQLHHPFTTSLTRFSSVGVAWLPLALQSGNNNRISIQLLVLEYYCNTHVSYRSTVGTEKRNLKSLQERNNERKGIINHNPPIRSPTSPANTRAYRCLRDPTISHL